MFESYDRIVRCSEGHLFTTIWIPLVSLKAVRLGRRRYQWCPVGDHRSMVGPINEANLSPGELLEAQAVHDRRIP